VTIGATGRGTSGGSIEIKLTTIEGRSLNIALMPSFARKIAELLQRLADSPELIGDKKMPREHAELLRHSVTTAGKPQPGGLVAEIPLERDFAERLIGHLERGIAALD